MTDTTTPSYDFLGQVSWISPVLGEQAIDVEQRNGHLVLTQMFFPHYSMALPIGMVPDLAKLIAASQPVEITDAMVEAAFVSYHKGKYDLSFLSRGLDIPKMRAALEAAFAARGATGSAGEDK